ncbi:hypothetical protein ACVWZ9_005093 [Pseudomonas chlororaphis]
MHRGYLFCDGCAADRRLRQRLHRSRFSCRTPNPVAAAEGCDRAPARQGCIPGRPDTPRSAVSRRLRRRSQAAPAATAIPVFQPNAEPCSRCRRLRSGASPPSCIPGRPDAPRSAVSRRLRRRSQAAPAATAISVFLPNAELCSRCRRLRSGASPPGCIPDRPDARDQRFCDGCAADRRLRQRLHRSRFSCRTPNPVAAAEGCDRAPARQACIPDRPDARGQRFHGGCAADRGLRQRLQGGVQVLGRACCGAAFFSIRRCRPGAFSILGCGACLDWGLSRNRTRPCSRIV